MVANGATCASGSIAVGQSGRPPPQGSALLVSLSSTVPLDVTTLHPALLALPGRGSLKPTPSCPPICTAWICCPLAAWLVGYEDTGQLTEEPPPPPPLTSTEQPSECQSRLPLVNLRKGSIGTGGIRGEAMPATVANDGPPGTRGVEEGEVDAASGARGVLPPGVELHGRGDPLRCGTTGLDDPGLRISTPAGERCPGPTFTEPLIRGTGMLARPLGTFVVLNGLALWVGLCS